jgi:hypothetical protein
MLQMAEHAAAPQHDAAKEPSYIYESVVIETSPGKGEQTVLMLGTAKNGIESRAPIVAL